MVVLAGTPALPVIVTLLPLYFIVEGFVPGRTAMSKEYNVVPSRA